MASSVEQIKAKLSIVEVVGSYLKLEKAGVNYRGKCPFHNEKTPSFFVSPTRGSYHCFGCNRGGDIISFVQEIEGLDFIEALRVLAERAGVELEPLRRNETAGYNRLFSLLEEATKFYAQQLTLPQNRPAHDYLIARGLTEESIKNFRLGFVPEAWRSVYDHLLRLGYREEEMIKVGLVVANMKAGPQASQGYDRFRSRLMFPIANPTGKVVGFSGRIFGPETATTAKYINTPQTELYNKSKILYGYDRAKQAMRQKDECIFVEGQMDLIMSYQAGATNTVAVSGTALTAEHIQLVKRLTDNIVLANDYDLAGLKASLRAINLIRQEEINVKIAKLPSGQDPAEVIKDNPAQWSEIIAEAKHYIDFMIDALQEEGKTGLELNLAINDYVLPYIKALTKKMEQAHFVAKLAGLLRISEEAIWADLQKIKLDENIAPPAKPAGTEALIVPEAIGRLKMIEEKILGLYFLLINSGQTEKVSTKLTDLWGADIFKTKIEGAEPERERLALMAELWYDPESDPLVELDDLVLNWQEERLKTELNQALVEVQSAERNKAEGELAISLKKCQELSMAINKLKK
ncbi:MAG: DNA primase [Candidatus Paceibacterota bacterium]|jgi:DNA primase